MAERVILTNVFGTPRSAEDSYTYDDRSTINLSDSDADGDGLGDSTGVPVDGLLNNGDYIEPLPVPTISIYEQIVRKTPSGMQVVDVIFEVEDFPGIDTYEFQVTKIN